MSPSNGERRYSEDEFALILRMASESDVEAGPTERREGLTLPQIRSIAAEAGIDPDKVSRAAASLPSATETTASLLLGGTARHRFEHAVSGAVPRGELGRVIDVARRELATQGESREVMDGLEWKGGTSTASVVVSITPRDNETVVQLSADRSETLAGVYAGVGLPVAGIIAVTLGKLVFGESDAGIAAAIVSGFLPSLFIARGLWKRSTRKWRRRLLELLGALVQEAEAAGTRREIGDSSSPGSDTGNGP